MGFGLGPGSRMKGMGPGWDQDGGGKIGTFGVGTFGRIPWLFFFKWARWFFVFNSKLDFREGIFFRCFCKCFFGPFLFLHIVSILG